MEGRPGSMSAYSRAERGCFLESDGPGPSDYDVKNSGIPIEDGKNNGRGARKC